MSSDPVTGKPILQRLTGRTNEFAHLPSGKIVPALTFYYITKTAIEKEGDIKELIVKQVRKNTFDIIYIAKEELYDNQKQKIQRAIDQYLEPNLSLNFIKTQDIKRSKSGKLKQFMSEVSH